MALFFYTINTVNSHQHISTSINRGFGQQYFREGTLSLSLLPLKTTSTMSTDSNNCNRGSTTSQIHGFVFVSMSTLSTAINTSQHLSTKALARNNSKKGHYPGVCCLLKPHQQCQHTATTATELLKVFVTTSTLSTTINRCQHLSPKTFASNNSM